MQSIGATLRAEREARELTLEELALSTRIPLRSLRLLEEDRFDALPGEVFVRGFLRSYSRAVGIDPTPLLSELRRGPAPSAPVTVPSVAPPEGGRRFGMAVALVVLLILFTLALSVVLRPRRRDVQIELSARQPAPSVLEAGRS
jgi:cytoskeletal protein RodZ